ncbi:MAG: hypothetical protein LC799_29365 [Actinobacteria bacterium]|nr:hypothetical protein [Actinomycetota bacterium]
MRTLLAEAAVQGLDARDVVQRCGEVLGSFGTGVGVSLDDGELTRDQSTDLDLRYPDQPTALARLGRPAAGRRGEQRCKWSAGIGQLSNSTRTSRRQYRTS